MSKSEARSVPKLRRTSPRKSIAPGSGVQRRIKGKRFPETRDRILLIEGDASMAQAYGSALSTCCELEVVHSAAAALEVLLVDNTIRLVLCAANTADVTACEFLHNLSWIVPGESPPVLVLGEASADESARARKLGAICCLPATTSLEMVVEEVQRFLRQERAPSQRPSSRPRRVGGAR